MVVLSFSKIERGRGGAINYGIDELLHVAQTTDGTIQWKALDPVTGENRLLGYFGQAGDQLAVGNWLTVGEPLIGVIGHGGGIGGTGADSRFNLQVPLDYVNLMPFDTERFRLP